MMQKNVSELVDWAEEVLIWLSAQKLSPEDNWKVAIGEKVLAPFGKLHGEFRPAAVKLAEYSRSQECQPNAAT